MSHPIPTEEYDENNVQEPDLKAIAEDDLSWTGREKDLIEYQAAREREAEIAEDNLRLI